MRLVLVRSFLALALIAAPLSAYAATATFFGPIIPTSGACTCPGQAPDIGCVLLVMQNLLNFAIALACLIVVLVIAYAGILFIFSPTSPENRSKARGILINAAVGLVIVLAAWLIIDFTMKLVYSGSGGTSGAFGPWNSILAGGPKCITPSAATPLFNGVLGTLQSLGQVPGNVPLASTGVGSCNSTTVQQDAAAGGYSLTNAQANELSCIAQYESSCGQKNASNYNENTICWNKTCPGKTVASSAAGPFQVLLGSNSSCYNNSVCEKAGGTPGTALNCNTAFHNGFPISGQTLNNCLMAAGDTACSAAASACLITTSPNGFMGAYSADSHAASCQASAGPGG